MSLFNGVMCLASILKSSTEEERMDIGKLTVSATEGKKIVLLLFFFNWKQVKNLYTSKQN